MLNLSKSGADCPLEINNNKLTLFFLGKTTGISGVSVHPNYAWSAGVSVLHKKNNAKIPLINVGRTDEAPTTGTQ